MISRCGTRPCVWIGWCALGFKPNGAFTCSADISCVGGGGSAISIVRICLVGLRAL
jgi:hypothetical protein